MQASCIPPSGESWVPADRAWFKSLFATISKHAASVTWILVRGH